MTKRLQIFKCETCGNIVEALHEGAGELVCCGQPMELLEEKSEDQGNEKHVPVFEQTGKGVKVKVGAVAHPMEENHYIEWIEVVADGKVCRKFLNPGDLPEAEFTLSPENIKAREYCSIHGLWKS
jgi:superoxide reductase